MKITDKFCLPHKVGVYVPSTIDVDTAINTFAIVREVEEALIECNGGITSIQGRGGWDGEEYGIVRESVVIVYSFCAEITPELDSLLLGIALDLKVKLRQQSIAIEIDGKLHLV